MSFSTKQYSYTFIFLLYVLCPHFPWHCLLSCHSASCWISWTDHTNVLLLFPIFKIILLFSFKDMSFSYFPTMMKYFFICLLNFQEFLFIILLLSAHFLFIAFLFHRYNISLYLLAYCIVPSVSYWSLLWSLIHVWDF